MVEPINRLDNEETTSVDAPTDSVATKAFDPAHFQRLYKEPEPEIDFESRSVPFQPKFEELFKDRSQEETTPIPFALDRPLPRSFENSQSLEEAEELSYAQLAADEEYIEMLNDYMVDRLGEKDGKKANETNEDFIKRFVAHVRRFEFNSFKLSQQLSWVRNASEEERMEFGHLYTQLEKLPTFYESGGAGFAGAIRDFGASLLLDPLNYIGFGAGGVARLAASRGVVQALKSGGKRSAIKQAANTARNISVGGIAAESGLAAIQNRKLQEVQKLADMRDSINYVEVAGIGALGLGLGVGSVALTGGLSRRRALSGVRTGNKRVDEIANRVMGGSARQELRRQRAHARSLKNRETAGINAAVDSAEAASLKTTDNILDLGEGKVPSTYMLNFGGKFDVEKGRETLKRLGDVKDTDLTQAEFNIQVVKRVGKVVTETISELAESGKLGAVVDEDTKASEVISQVITERLQKAKTRAEAESIQKTGKENLIVELDKALLKSSSLAAEGEEAFDAALEAAIARSGLSIEQFTDAMGASYSTAGQYLQTAAEVGRIIKSLGRIDPKLEAILKETSPTDDAAGFMGRAMEFVRRLDRNRRALMVSQIATTIRNVATGAARITMETGADLMESAIYQLGRGQEAARIGNPDIAPGNFVDIFKDGIGKLHRLRTVSNTRTLTDGLLNHNRNLAAKLDRTLQEATENEARDLLNVTKYANTLNVAQDQFFRRAIFVNSVNKKLKRAGIIVDKPAPGSGKFASLDEFVASGKTLPGAVLSDSIEDALDFTFSRMPKGNEFGARFVQYTEAVGPLPVPITNTIMFPFARFMVNALKFQYEFSPFGFYSAVTQRQSGKHFTAMAEEAKKLGKFDEATENLRKASMRFQKSREAVSKAAMGTAAFSAAVYHRYNNQDIKFYEYKTADGGTGDLRPYFPLAPYLAVADLFVKSFITRDFNNIDTKDLLAAITGAQARTGLSSYVLDKFGQYAGAFRGLDTVEAEKVSEMLGKVAAEYAGSFVTPGRIVRDIVASYDTEEATLRDASQVDGSFFNALKNGIYKNLPGAARHLPALESPTREGPVYRERSLLGQLGAPRLEAQRNPAEAELVRLGIKRYTVGARTGNKTADALANRVMGGIVEQNVSELIASDRYQAMSDVEKRVVLTNGIQAARNTAKEIAIWDARTEASVQGVGSTPFDRGAYNRLPSRKRALADEYYLEKYGKTVMQMAEEQPDVNHYGSAVSLVTALEDYLQ